MINENRSLSTRIHSLDALRGFDMFWIMGGGSLFIGLGSLTKWSVFQWWAGQLEHVPWNGFHFYDMIFPLFLFIAGISFPFSLAKRTAMKDSRRSIYTYVIKRGVILVILGIFYNEGLRFNFDTMRYSSVLGRIGLAWMFAALIYMNTKLSFRIVWFWTLLIGYWLLLLLFPAHDLGSIDPFSQEGNLSGFIDRLILPGRLSFGNYEPQGLFSTIPAIGIPLLGMFTGEFLMSNYLKDNLLRKVFYLALSGIAFIFIAAIWDGFFPINKNLWSSSFICLTCGISLLLFSCFYLVIDVWHFKKWAFFFVVIGMNPITIYLACKIIKFDSASKFFFGGLINLLPNTWTSFIDGIGITTIGWIFLYILYKKKIFIKL